MNERRQLLGALRAAGGMLITTLVLALLVDALVPAATALTVAHLIAEAADASSGMSDVAPALAMFAVLLLAGYSAAVVSQLLSFLARARIDGAHRSAILRLILDTPTIDTLEDPHVQSLIESARADIRSWTERTPAQGALEQLRLIAAALGVTSSVAVLAQYSWWLVPLVLLPALANTVIRGRLARAFTYQWRAQSRHGRYADVWQQAVISPGEGKDLRTFGLGEWVVQRIQDHILRMFSPIWSAQMQLLRREWIQFVLVTVPLAVGLPLVAHSAATGTTSLATAVSALTAAWSVYQATLILDPRTMQGSLAAMNAFSELREALAGNSGDSTTDAPGSDDVTVAADDGAGPPLVRFEKLSFIYPGTQRRVLDNVDFEIRPGELLALVGLNGAGKSTVIKLLAGLYAPTSGRITADGTDISAMAPVAWRRTVAVVFQDFVRYPLSLRDNITLGSDRGTGDQRTLDEVAAEAGIGDIVDRLPLGWDTPLARSRSRGVDLSGGQWQQVVRARALYSTRAGARLLVLDEPTAHLDVQTELEVFEGLAQQRGAVSVVLISHRLSTIRRADRILLLDKGRIAEVGTHEELMERGGAYAEMFALQAERYRLGYEDRVEEGELR
ncbi:ABC transporter ATP-binding protein [Streptomyces sp. ME19-01-6]|uniref:ABC transporter ATP-binding protein n=1 Tax=Streptomyces sp. ME19-01-6 TaxID=3028686 RepID=UPI0029AC7323|nr:ABC transporter ATP-binding protein [Streptomyces sp. ME19-01-6]MDX3225233.1 ABC transporter ATP-binding protein [Streptomyces sp. ME19-01-6]